MLSLCKMLENRSCKHEIEAFRQQLVIFDITCLFWHITLIFEQVQVVAVLQNVGKSPITARVVEPATIIFQKLNLLKIIQYPSLIFQASWPVRIKRIRIRALIGGM